MTEASAESDVSRCTGCGGTGVLRVGSELAENARYCTECGGALMPTEWTPEPAQKSGLMAWMAKGHPLVVTLKWLGLLVVVGLLALMAVWGLAAGLCLGAAVLS